MIRLVCVCVFFPFILDIKFVGHTKQPGSHRRKVTQDLSCTFLRLLVLIVVKTYLVRFGLRIETRTERTVL